jgi:hypothetical protein
MRKPTSKAILDNCRCPKPSAKQMRKWNRVLRQYTAEMDQLEQQLGYAKLIESPPLKEWGNRSSLWDDMEMFGLVIEDDNSLTGFWIDPETGSRHGSYWIPDGRESEIPTIDTPSYDGVAWDAKPIFSNSIAIG